MNIKNKLMSFDKEILVDSIIDIFYFNDSQAVIPDDTAFLTSLSYNQKLHDFRALCEQYRISLEVESLKLQEFLESNSESDKTSYLKVAHENTELKNRIISKTLE